MRERTRQAADFGALVDVLADWFVEVHPRTAGISAVIAWAAAVDGAAAQLEKDRGQQRLRRYEEAAAAARSRGGLRSGMTDAEGAAAIWSLGHPPGLRVPGAGRRLVGAGLPGVDRQGARLMTEPAQGLRQLQGPRAARVLDRRREDRQCPLDHLLRRGE